ncbi:MAG TPA: signal peptidase II [Paracoccaceae bacterium]|nr:signal peptidase II [Paracoccaceae bacterium]
MPQGLRRTLATALALFALDRFTKILVVVWLDLAARGALDVLPPFLNLRMAWNRGVNFGLFATGSDWGRWLLVGLAAAISLALALWARRAPGWLTPACTGAIIGGALGNALDRVIYGAVADFLNMSCCGIDNPFSFNLADIGIFAGAMGLILFAGGQKAAQGGPKSGRDASGRVK